MNFGGGGGGGGASGAITGEELRDIETEHIGFQAASGEDKLQILPEPWPSDNLPPPTASLLSVAPKTGLLAAAGPGKIVIASTGSVRNTFINGTAEGENKIKKFAPQAVLSVPRVSQVAFSSDESCLVISAEQGGGLAVYDTVALKSGNASVAFEMSTQGESVRQFLPNPNWSPEVAGFFGIVTTHGKLLLADLKERKLVTAASGTPVFAENVSCASWSRLGKQIIAGLADGTAVQIDRQGSVKARIPVPPQLEQLKDPSATAMPITSIFWLETDDFLLIHTPINAPGSTASDDSIYHLAHRNDKQGQSWTFQKFPQDPCFPIVERKPAHHYIQRIREWSNLTEMLIISSSASADIGVLTKAKVALNITDQVIDTFTDTRLQDQRRAAIPLSIAGSMDDTSPIGMVIDLSTTELIQKPIPTDSEIDVSPIPLPALYTLNYEGILSMWWIVHNAAVREKTVYADLIAAGGPRVLSDQKPQQQAQPAAQPSSTSPFGSSAFGSASNTPASGSAFGQPAFGALSNPASAPAFGKPAFGAPSAPAFGSTASPGMRQSPWGAPASAATGGSAFGKPAFGQPSAFGASSFGQPSGIGGSSSIWGAPQSSQQQTPASSVGIFGGNSSNQSPFMTLGGNAGASPFAAFGGNTNAASPFASAAKPTLSAEPSGSTVSFGNNTSFGSGSSNFGIQSQPSVFGSPTPSAASNVFGKPSQPASREESMTDDNTSGTHPTAQPSGQAESKSPFGLPSGGFKLGSTFKGDGSAKDDLPKPSNPGGSLFGSGFGNALGETSKAPSKPSTPLSMFGQSTPPIKKEPSTEQVPKLSDIPPAPTPLKTEEKVASPAVEDAPLPPDPTTWKSKPGALPPPIPPGFGKDFVTPTKKDEEKTPLPSKDNDESLAGSPPIDLGKETFSEGVSSDAKAQGPADEEEGESFSEEEDEDGEKVEEGEEGEEVEGEWSDEEGEEDEEDEDEDQHTPKIEDQTGLSAFQARITPASPKREEQPESTTPATETKKSYTPAGLPKAPIMFAPPQRKGPESPRSPSPQRSATSPLRQASMFSSQQAPPRPQLPTGNSRPPSSSQTFGASQSRNVSEAQPLPPQRIAVPPAQLTQPPKRSPAPPQPEEPDTGNLEDEEDARVQAILTTPLGPRVEVPAFLAHQDYVATGAERPGVGGQIERVFRDINSMIDTVALNARGLAEFVAGNTSTDQRAIDRLDLESEQWILSDAQGLGGVIEGIETQLGDGRLTDVRDALSDLHEDEEDLNKLRAKAGEVRKQIMLRRDPKQVAQQYQAPLPMETQTLQFELRQEVQNVQKLLAKAEEQLSVLRAELASLPASNGDAGAAVNVPTVEAVEKTIRRMTEMIERKSGDVDVLESQIRRLGGPATLGLRSSPGKLAVGYEDDLVSGLKASRLDRSSPAAAAALRASQLRNSTFGSPSVGRRARNATPGTPGSGLRRSVFDVPDEEVEAYRKRREARREVLAGLREKVVERGVRVVKVGEA